MENLIRFDWAMKRLLRDKSNYVVLEGFLSTLLEEDVHICKFLESESNLADASDKFNRADILAEDSKGELLIIEVQNNRELDYFHRILYGVSKTIAEYIGLGDAYSKVRKVYSINIVYFDLGEGKDYVYHGKTDFRGLHNPNDILRLSVRQREIFVGKEAGDLFKTGEIEGSSMAKGLPEARERLRLDSLNADEKRAYYRDMEAQRYQRSVIETGRIEGREEGRAEGRAEGKVEGRVEGLKEASEKIARNLKQLAVPIEVITKSTGLTSEEIEAL